MILFPIAGRLDIERRNRHEMEGIKLNGMN